MNSRPPLRAVVRRDCAAVDGDGVADNRQAEPRAAHLARTPLVDAVEAFEDVGQVLLFDADAVVGEGDGARLLVVGQQADEDVASRGVGRGVVRQVAEDGGEQRGAAADFDRPREVAVDAQPAFGRQQLDVGRHLGDDVVEHDGLLADELAPLVHARDDGDIGEQLSEAARLGQALLEEGALPCGVDAGVGQQRLQVALDGRHGGLQLVVDVVGKLLLDADFLLLLVQHELVLAVAFGGRLLQLGVEADDVVRDVAQLVVGEGLALGDDLAALGPLGEVAQADDVVAQAARGEVARHAHQQRDAQHEPEKAPVGGQHLAQFEVVGERRADDEAVAPHGRVEVVSVGALREALERISRAVDERRAHLGTVEVVGQSGRVAARVVVDAPLVVENRQPQPREAAGIPGHERVGPHAGGQLVEQAEVEQLEPGVEPLDFEVLLAAVLVGDEAAHEHPRDAEQQQEEPPVVGEPTFRNRSHSPGG